MGVKVVLSAAIGPSAVIILRLFTRYWESAHLKTFPDGTLTSNEGIAVVIFKHVSESGLKRKNETFDRPQRNKTPI